MGTTTSKTLTQALSELINGLKESDCVTITNLAKQLAETLPYHYKVYLLPKKKLKFSLKRQSASSLYTATYTLIDNDDAIKEGS